MKPQHVVVATTVGAAVLCAFAILAFMFPAASFVDQGTQLPMPATTLLLLGATMALAMTGARVRRWCGIIAGAVAATGWTILLSYARQEDAWSVRLRESWLAGTCPPPHAAAGLLLIGLALLCVSTQRHRWVRIGHILALVTLCGSKFVLIAYFFRARELYTLAPGVQMSPLSAAIIALLSFGTLSVTPRVSVVSIFYSATEGGKLARRFVPFVFGAPLLLSALIASGLTQGLYSTEAALALLSMGVVVVLGTLSWRYALDAHASEARLERIVQHRTHRLTETIEELEGFAQALSHDVRGPLINLREFLSILANDHVGDLPEEARDYLERAVRATRRVDYLTVAMLRYGELSRRSFDLRPIDLDPVVLATVDEVQREQDTPAQFSVERPLGRVLADSDGLRLVMRELVANACRFTRPGLPVRVAVSAHPRGDVIQIRVRDEGVGIRPEFHERIFRPFEQLVRSNQNAGIGLALVKRAVTKMNGAVGVASDGSDGSMFWVELPRAA